MHLCHVSCFSPTTAACFCIYRLWGFEEVRDSDWTRETENFWLRWLDS